MFNDLRHMGLCRPPRLGHLALSPQTKIVRIVGTGKRLALFLMNPERRRSVQIDCSAFALVCLALYAGSWL